MWLRLFHVVGLTNLSDQEVDKFAKFVEPTLSLGTGPFLLGLVGAGLSYAGAVGAMIFIGSTPLPMLLSVSLVLACVGFVAGFAAQVLSTLPDRAHMARKRVHSIGRGQDPPDLIPGV